MKRVLSLAMAFALATSQAFSYTVEDLQKVENCTASLTTAGAMLKAVVPVDLNAGLSQFGELSREANNLIAYAIEDQSFQVRIARVINRVATKASWQKAPAIDGAFMKNFSVELTHGVTGEVADYFKGKALGAVMPQVSDSRLVGRAAQALSTAIVTSLVETTFMHINRALEVPGAACDKDKKCTEKLMGTFFNSLLTEVAFQFAGEAILRGASDAKADALSDLCAAQVDGLDSAK